MPPTEGLMLKIKLVKSPIGNNPRNRATVVALGLRKIGQVVEQPDNLSIRGMIHKISHMLVVEVPEGAEPMLDATNPGSSARMLNKKIHRKMDRKPNVTHRHGRQK
jgi:large subunit ribosomal protein L30